MSKQETLKCSFLFFAEIIKAVKIFVTLKKIQERLLQSNFIDCFEMNYNIFLNKTCIAGIFCE